MNRRKFFGVLTLPFVARWLPAAPRVVEWRMNTTGLIRDITRSTYPWWRNQQMSSSRAITNDMFRAVRLGPIYLEHK